MSDWRTRLERELAGLPLPPGRQGDLVEELAQDLEERARVARLRGVSEEEAALEAWNGLGSLEELRARLCAWKGSRMRARGLARRSWGARRRRPS